MGQWREWDVNRSEEIDMKVLLLSLMEYRRSIFFVVVVTTLISAYIAYFKPSIYSAETLVKITSERQGYYEDFLMVAPVGQNGEIDDDLIVFKSRPIAERVLKKLNLGTRYYTKKRLRTLELYKNTPFTVSYTYLSPDIYGVPFLIVPVDKEHFRLELKEHPSSIVDILLAYIFEPSSEKTKGKVYTYDTTIQNELFTLQVHKVYDLSQREYWFTMVPNERMVNFVQSGISASTITKFGSIVSLKFYDTVPSRAAEIINQVAEAYIEQNLELKSKGAKKQLYFIDMQLDAINKTLKGSAEKLQKYKATNIVVNLSEKAQLTANKLSGYESKLYTVNMQLEIAESMLMHIIQQKSTTMFSLDYGQSDNVVINNLLEKIQKAMTKYAALSAKYTEKHPGVITLKKELRFLRESLIKTLQSHIATLKKEKIHLQQVIEEQQRRLQEVPKQEQQLEQLSRHFMVNEKIYSYLLEKRAETAILASSTISNTHIVQKALAPYYPVKPKRKLYVFIGFLIGIILGVLQALIRNFLDNTIKSNEDIEKLTDIPIYGTLPIIKEKKGLSAYMEAVRSLWVNLAFVRGKGKSKVVSSTSNISGEGKTFTIYHLGKMIAKSSEDRVVILDMDMRRATLHKKFGITNDHIGASTVLSGAHTIKEAIRHTDIPNLDLILSGPKAPNPTRLIMSDAFDDMLIELSKEYDHILIDTPPIGIVSDAMKIMHASDLVLFIIKAEYSKKEFIQTINRLNKKEEINLGIVLNGVDYEKSYYYYGYGYQYTSDEYYLER